MRHLKQILASLLLCLAAPGANAQNVAETIFTDSALADARAGDVLRYDYVTLAPEGAGIRAFEDGAATLDMVQSDDGGMAVLISMERGEATSNLHEMPISGGNPLVLIFLEQTARAMAKLTGGSPYYIRNRIKEALLTDGQRQPREVTLDGADAPVTEITLRPFADDPNRDRMGAFHDVELTFRYGDGVPGGIAELDAQVAGPGDAPIYRQTLSYTGMEPAR